MHKSTPSFNAESVERQWHLIDLDGQTVGRAAAVIASMLRGKHKPTFTPHVDHGDFIVCINADKLVFTGTKPQKKIYKHHTNYPGGIKEISAEKLLAHDSVQVLHLAVKGMLPKNKLGRAMFTKLKAYQGAEHPHQAQQPVPFDLSSKT
jgi:large subunit ribosomal protein L13